MCGISGIVNKENESVERNSIKKINDLISHRGPDDEGFFFGKNFAFGHRRLSILDLSSDGHQPMSFKDKFTITYNGEIYNFIEIREELTNYGYSFKSNSDTEVILASYDKWGEDCVKRFNGMWAFAIHDKVKNIIFASRDRFGIKPFYFSEVDGQFVFGSEIKQLLEFHKKRFANKDIILDYLVNGLVEHTSRTFYKGVFKLPQSNNLLYDLSDHSYEITPYYKIDISKKYENDSEEQSIDKFRELFQDSIKLRLRSDVKVGTCLSGGLDSSSVASIAAELYSSEGSSQFTAIHAKSTEAKTDESYYANVVADKCNLDLHITEPGYDDFINSLEQVVFTQEEPFGSPSIFMQYYVMEKAKEIGCTVMLDGQGGDETLFGYERYYAVYFASLLRKIKLLSFVKEFIKLESIKTPKWKILRSIIMILHGNVLSRVHSTIKKKKLCIKSNEKINSLNSFLTFKKFQVREIMLKNLPALLRYEDKNSMRHSIETRLPFIDYRCVNLCTSLNDRYKFKNGFLKYILRKSINDRLPEEIVWRKNKFGFEAPTDTWLKKHKSSMLKDIKQSKILNSLCDIEKVSFSDNFTFWRFYNVFLWEKVFKVEL